MADKEAVEVLAYLRDVQDCLNQCIEDMHEITELCQQMNEAHKMHQGLKHTRTLSILTVVTTTLLPIQVLSRVYAMNFCKLNLKP